MQVGESRRGAGCRGLERLWGVVASFPRRVNLDARSQWAGLASGEEKPSTGEVTCLGMAPHHDLLRWASVIRSPFEVTSPQRGIPAAAAGTEL